MTVFVTQENHRINYTPAMAFGEIVFISNREFSPQQQSLNNQTIIERIEEMAKSFNPNSDHLLFSGDPVQIALSFHFVSMSARSQGATHISILKWDGKAQYYNNIVLPV